MNEKVFISQGITINLGNYQSYRIDIAREKSFSIKEDTSQDELNNQVDQKYNELCDFVEEKLREKVKEKTNLKINKE